jgi:hypothetical protein
MAYNPSGFRQQPQQHGSGWPPTSESYPTVDEPPRDRSWLAYAALAAAILVLAGGVWTAYDRGLILKDAGIAACESLRDGKTVEGAPIDTKADNKMTEAQYLQLREVFRDSRHDDIEKAGTALIDVMWQVTQLGKDPGLEALPFLGQMMSALTGLQGACANHGIVVNIAKDARSAN